MRLAKRLLLLPRVGVRAAGGEVGDGRLESRKEVGVVILNLLLWGDAGFCVSTYIYF